MPARSGPNRAVAWAEQLEQHLQRRPRQPHLVEALADGEELGDGLGPLFGLPPALGGQPLLLGPVVGDPHDPAPWVAVAPLADADRDRRRRRPPPARGGRERLGDLGVEQDAQVPGAVEREGRRVQHVGVLGRGGVEPAGEAQEVRGAATSRGCWPRSCA